ncbi:MAG: hypothetical protein ACM3OC_02095, partial [Deltaproteobacteria bacterium]
MVIFSRNQLFGYDLEITQNKAIKFVVAVDKDTTGTEFIQAVRRNRNYAEPKVMAAEQIWMVDGCNWNKNTLVEKMVGTNTDTLKANEISNEAIARNDNFSKAFHEAASESVINRFERGKIQTGKMDMYLAMMKEFQSIHKPDDMLAPRNKWSNLADSIRGMSKTTAENFLEVYKMFDNGYVDAESGKKYILTSEDRALMGDWVKFDKQLVKSNGIRFTGEWGKSMPKTVTGEDGQLMLLQQRASILPLARYEFSDLMTLYSKAFTHDFLAGRKISSPSMRMAVVDAAKFEAGQSREEVARVLEQGMKDQGVSSRVARQQTSRTIEFMSRESERPMFASRLTVENGKIVRPGQLTATGLKFFQEWNALAQDGGYRQQVRSSLVKGMHFSQDQVRNGPELSDIVNDQLKRLEYDPGLSAYYLAMQQSSMADGNDAKLAQLEQMADKVVNNTLQKLAVYHSPDLHNYVMDHMRRQGMIISEEAGRIKVNADGFLLLQRLDNLNNLSEVQKTDVLRYFDGTLKAPDPKVERYDFSETGNFADRANTQKRLFDAARQMAENKVTVPRLLAAIDNGKQNKLLIPEISVLGKMENERDVAYWAQYKSREAGIKNGTVELAQKLIGDYDRNQDKIAKIRYYADKFTYVMPVGKNLTDKVVNAVADSIERHYTRQYNKNLSWDRIGEISNSLGLKGLSSWAFFAPGLSSKETERLERFQAAYGAIVNTSKVSFLDIKDSEDFSKIKGLPFYMRDYMPEIIPDFKIPVLKRFLLPHGIKYYAKGLTNMVIYNPAYAYHLRQNLDNANLDIEKAATVNIALPSKITARGKVQNAVKEAKTGDLIVVKGVKAPVAMVKTSTGFDLYLATGEVIKDAAIGQVLPHVTAIRLSKLDAKDNKNIQGGYKKLVNTVKDGMKGVQPVAGNKFSTPMLVPKAEAPELSEATSKTVGQNGYEMLDIKPIKADVFTTYNIIGGYNVARGQYDASRILKLSQNLAKDTGFEVVPIKVDRDIYATDSIELNRIFGLGTDGGSGLWGWKERFGLADSKRGAIISSFPLMYKIDEFMTPALDERVDNFLAEYKVDTSKLTRKQQYELYWTTNEAIHELGHAFGRVHVSNPNDIMYKTSTVFDVFLRGSKMQEQNGSLAGMNKYIKEQLNEKRGLALPQISSSSSLWAGGILNDIKVDDYDQVPAAKMRNGTQVYIAGNAPSAGSEALLVVAPQGNGFFGRMTFFNDKIKVPNPQEIAAYSMTIGHAVTHRYNKVIDYLNYCVENKIALKAEEQEFAQLLKDRGLIKQENGVFSAVKEFSVIGVEETGVAYGKTGLLNSIPYVAYHLIPSYRQEVDRVWEGLSGVEKTQFKEKLTEITGSNFEGPEGEALLIREFLTHFRNDQEGLLRAERIHSDEIKAFFSKENRVQAPVVQTNDVAGRHFRTTTTIENGQKVTQTVEEAPLPDYTTLRIPAPVTVPATVTAPVVKNYTGKETRVGDRIFKEYKVTENGQEAIKLEEISAPVEIEDLPTPPVVPAAAMPALNYTGREHRVGDRIFKEYRAVEDGVEVLKMQETPAPAPEVVEHVVPVILKDYTGREMAAAGRIFKEYRVTESGRQTFKWDETLMVAPKMAEPKAPKLEVKLDNDLEEGILMVRDEQAGAFRVNAMLNNAPEVMAALVANGFQRAVLAPIQNLAAIKENEVVELNAKALQQPNHARVAQFLINNQIGDLKDAEKDGGNRNMAEVPAPESVPAQTAKTVQAADNVMPRIEFLEIKDYNDALNSFGKLVSMISSAKWQWEEILPADIAARLGKMGAQEKARVIEEQSKNIAATIISFFNPSLATTQRPELKKFYQEILPKIQLPGQAQPQAMKIEKAIGKIAVANLNGKQVPVGFSVAVTGKVNGEPSMYIAYTALSKEGEKGRVWHQGAMEKLSLDLLKPLLSMAEVSGMPAYLHVLPTNTRAFTNYTKLGFSAVGMNNKSLLMAKNAPIQLPASESKNVPENRGGNGTQGLPVGPGNGPGGRPYVPPVSKDGGMGCLLDTVGKQSILYFNSLFKPTDPVIAMLIEGHFNSLSISHVHRALSPGISFATGVLPNAWSWIHLEGQNIVTKFSSFASLASGIARKAVSDNVRTVYGAVIGGSESASQGSSQGTKSAPARKAIPVNSGNGSTGTNGDFGAVIVVKTSQTALNSGAASAVLAANLGRVLTVIGGLFTHAPPSCVAAFTDGGIGGGRTAPTESAQSASRGTDVTGKAYGAVVGMILKVAQIAQAAYSVLAGKSSKELSVISGSVSARGQPSSESEQTEGGKTVSSSAPYSPSLKNGAVVACFSSSISRIISSGLASINLLNLPWLVVGKIGAAGAFDFRGNNGRVSPNVNRHNNIGGASWIRSLLTTLSSSKRTAISTPQVGSVITTILSFFLSKSRTVLCSLVTDARNLGKRFLAAIVAMLSARSSLPAIPAAFLFTRSTPRSTLNDGGLTSAIASFLFAHPESIYLGGTALFVAGLFSLAVYKRYGKAGMAVALVVFSALIIGGIGVIAFMGANVPPVGRDGGLSAKDGVMAGLFGATATFTIIGTMILYGGFYLPGFAVLLVGGLFGVFSIVYLCKQLKNNEAQPAKDGGKVGALVVNTMTVGSMGSEFLSEIKQKYIFDGGDKTVKKGVKRQVKLELARRYYKRFGIRLDIDDLTPESVLMFELELRGLIQPSWTVDSSYYLGTDEGRLLFGSALRKGLSFVLLPMVLTGTAGLGAILTSHLASASVADHGDINKWLQEHQGHSDLYVSHPGDAILSDWAMTYDQALVAIYFVEHNDSQHASQILDFFASHQDHKLYYTAYHADNGAVAEWRQTAGPTAWIGIAMAQYDQTFHTDKYQDSIKAIGDTLIQYQKDNGGIRGGTGNDGTYASTEHNLDAFALFDYLAKTTGDPKYSQARDAVGNWLVTVAYDKDTKSFKRGENDPIFATDVQAWGASMPGLPSAIDKNGLISAAEDNAKVTVMYNGDTITGFDFDNSIQPHTPVMISGEWTGEMVIAYSVNGNPTEAQYYVGQMDKMQNADGTMPYATLKGADTGHYWKTPGSSASISSTIYWDFAQDSYNPLNIYTPVVPTVTPTVTPVPTATPTPGFGFGELLAAAGLLIGGARIIKKKDGGNNFGITLLQFSEPSVAGGLRSIAAFGSLAKSPYLQGTDPSFVGASINLNELLRIAGPYRGWSFQRTIAANTGDLAQSPFLQGTDPSGEVSNLICNDGGINVAKVQQKLLNTVIVLAFVGHSAAGKTESMVEMRNRYPEIIAIPTKITTRKERETEDIERGIVESIDEGEFLVGQALERLVFTRVEFNEALKE